MIKLTDSIGRSIRKLRVSLTDQCNLRCHYCMPEESTFMPKSHYLSAQSLAQILQELKDRGLEEVRFTGGEPLLRSDLQEIIESANKIGFQKLAITTNGILLNKFLTILKENNVEHLNISLDTFDQDTFYKISRRKNVQGIIENILHANDQGFHVKINCVVMRGVNDHEIFDMVEFSQKHKIEVRFLELMQIGIAIDENSTEFISAREMLSRIDQNYQLTPVTKESDSTSYNFRTSAGAQIGFIASESQPFCQTCSRWRLSADGILRSCLFKTEGINLKDLNQTQRHHAYHAVLAQKPMVRAASVEHYMHQIGG